MSEPDQAASFGPAYFYPLHEALLTQLGRDLEAEGRLVVAEEIRFLDLFNLLGLVEKGPSLLDVLRDMQRMCPEQYDRLVSAWHWRDRPAAAGLRDWLRSQGGLDRAGLLAARDRLAVLAGVSPSRVDLMPLQTVLDMANRQTEPAALPSSAEALLAQVEDMLRIVCERIADPEGFSVTCPAPKDMAWGRAQFLFAIRRDMLPPVRWIWAAIVKMDLAGAPEFPGDPKDAGEALTVLCRARDFLRGFCEAQSIQDNTTDNEQRSEEEGGRSSSVRGKVRQEGERRILEQMAIAKLFTHGPNLSAIARDVGVPRNTLRDWPEFASAFEKAKNQAEQDKEERKQRHRRSAESQV